MKICPKCKKPSDDGAVFCVHCGSSFDAENAFTQPSQNQQSTQISQAPQTPQVPQMPPVSNQDSQNQQTPPPFVQAQFYAPMPVANPYDHTSEFDAKDISDNKVISMIIYLLGTVGIIIALLAAHSSPYASFHVRQALKFTVVGILSTIVAVLLFWTIIVPILYAILSIALFVCKIICFFSICNGKAVEPPIIRSLGFLR